jgi:hypothetical protein
MDKKLAKEALERTLLLMKYNTSKTLNENVEVISEQSQSIYKSAVAGGVAGATVGSAAFGVGAIPGALVGAIAGAALNFFNNGGYDKAKKLFEACKTSPGVPTLTDEDFDALTQRLHKAIDYTWGTDEDEISNVFKGIKTIPDLCGLSKNYEETYGNLLDDLDGEFENDTEWADYFQVPLKPAIRKSKQLTDAAAQIGKFNGFTCLKANELLDGKKSIEFDKNNPPNPYLKVVDESGVLYYMSLQGKLYNTNFQDTGHTLKCSGKNTIVENKNGKSSLIEFVVPKKVGKQSVGKQSVGKQSVGYNKTTAVLQQQLYDSGYYIGNSGQLKNGVDGVLGPKTTKAREAYMSQKTCATYNQENNFPMPPTCKSSSVTPKSEVKPEGEINVIDPSTY